MRLYVLARNYQQFRRWCWDKGIPELHATYVAHAERLVGQRFTAQQIVRVPGCEENIHAAAIEDAIARGLVTA